jgi:hypothetical protein
MQQEDRPGWGVFECLGKFYDDADLETFERVLAENGISVRG